MIRKAIILTAALLQALHSWSADIIVKPGDNIGSALRQAREWRRTADPRCEGGINIILAPGRHHLEEPIFIRPEDSGTTQSPTTLCGEPGAVVCGDPPQQHTQMFPKEGMERLEAFDAVGRTITIPTPPKQVLRMSNLEMVVHQRWAIAILRVKEMRVEGSHTIVTFREPESRLEFEHPWPQPVTDGERGNSSFLLRTTEQRLGLEQLVIISGTESDPVRHFNIKGITFENTCWNRPLQQGHVTLQGGFPIIDAYKLQQEGLPWAPSLENQAWTVRPVAAVTVSWASGVTVTGCTFRNLASTALDFTIGISDCTIDGNTFTHIGGTAILAGSFAESPRESHRPYMELPPLCRRLTISHNTIEDATCEDWGAVGIGCGYVREVTISHNTVRHVNYSGICVGWGWTPIYTGMQDNHITSNTVTDYACQLYDAGGIYTLSNQPGSSITDNEIGPPAAAPYATNHRAFHIYLDAETNGYTISGNRDNGVRVDREKMGFNNPGRDVKIE